MKKVLVLAATLTLAVAVALPLAASGASDHRTGAQAVSVTLKEYKFVSTKLEKAVFGKRSILKPGSTTFTFTNAGEFPHDFTIVLASPGATKFSSGMVAPGESKTMTVDLKPGAYLAACTQFNGFHWASGMVRAFS